MCWVPVLKPFRTLTIEKERPQEILDNIFTDTIAFILVLMHSVFARYRIYFFTHVEEDSKWGKERQIAFFPHAALCCPRLHCGNTAGATGCRKRRWWVSAGEKQFPLKILSATGSQSVWGRKSPPLHPPTLLVLCESSFSHHTLSD